MPMNDIAVLIFSFIALCVFIFCAASIVVQLRIHDLKRLLQDDYDKARRKLVGEWEEASEKQMNEIAALKLEIKAIRTQMVKKETSTEDLSSAAVLGTRSASAEEAQPHQSILHGGVNRLH